MIGYQSMAISTMSSVMSMRLLQTCGILTSLIVNGCRSTPSDHESAQTQQATSTLQVTSDIKYRKPLY